VQDAVLSNFTFSKHVKKCHLYALRMLVALYTKHLQENLVFYWSTMQHILWRSPKRFCTGNSSPGLRTWGMILDQ